jgi:hypothetical protein
MGVTKSLTKMALLAATALFSLSLIATAPAIAQSKEGGGHDGDDIIMGESGHDAGGHDDGGGESGQQGKRKQTGRTGISGHGSLRDVFREMEEEAAEDIGPGGIGHDEVGKKGKGGKDAAASPRKEPGKGTKGEGKKGTPGGEEADEDSDRPDWAGTPGSEGRPGRPNEEPGVKKGTIYGDMYVVLRDDDGVPLLDDSGYVKILFLYNDQLVCCVDRDAEGNLLTTGTLSDGTVVSNVLPIEIELGRLSVGRSPTRVLAAQLDEAVKSINDATSLSLDSAGRIVLTLSDGTTQTIDSPLENLALYVELLNTGTVAGVDTTKLEMLGFNEDGTISDADLLKIASSLFAAASDKTISITIDSIEYMNAILDLTATLDANKDGVIDDQDASFIDFTEFTYDREATYSSLTVTILETSDGGATWVPTEVNVYAAVFNSTELTASNVAGFTAAADDARTVINFLHTYSVPTTE